MRNQAFAFIKPHAMKSQAIATYIGDMFEDAEVQVLFEKTMTGKEIDASGAIDEQFARIRRMAVSRTADEYEITEAGRETFRFSFDEDWDDAVAKGRVLNSREAIGRMGDTTVVEFCTLWAENRAVELEPDVFVAHYVEQDFYVINGFYPALRAEYTDSEVAIRVMTLDFEMDWFEFMDRVIGAEHPAAAEEESIRGYIYERAALLEINVDPNDNIMHVSSSPFTALCEKVNWLGEECVATDPLLLQLMDKTGRSQDDVLDAVLAHAENVELIQRVQGLNTPEVASVLAEII